jgi:hypothetical protein
MRAIPRLTFAIVAIFATVFFVGSVVRPSCASIFGCGMNGRIDRLTPHTLIANVHNEPLGSRISDLLVMRGDELEYNSALVNVILAELVPAPDTNAIWGDEESTATDFLSPHIFGSDRTLMNAANKAIIDFLESSAANLDAPWYLADEDEFWSTQQVEEFTPLLNVTSTGYLDPHVELSHFSHRFSEKSNSVLTVGSSVTRIGDLHR